MLKKYPLPITKNSPTKLANPNSIGYGTLDYTLNTLDKAVNELKKINSDFRPSLMSKDTNLQVLPMEKKSSRLSIPFDEKYRISVNHKRTIIENPLRDKELTPMPVQCHVEKSSNDKKYRDFDDDQLSFDKNRFKFTCGEESF